MHTGAHALLTALTVAEVEVLFGYPGGTIMPTYDALYDFQDRLRHVLVRHEQGATHAAEGYARASGKLGVCLVTSGPGATNCVTGLMDALMDSTPLLCISGQVASPLLGTEAFQEAPVIELTRAATKWNYQITDPAEIPAAVAYACQVAQSGRPGPVLLDITKDAQIGTFATPRSLDFSLPPPIPPANDHALQAAAELLNSAERPLILAGHGVTIAGAEHALQALAEKSGTPVANTLHGLSSLATAHPLQVGMLGMHGNLGPNRLTNQADVILGVGMRFDDRVTGRLDAYARSANIIHIDIDPQQIGRLVPTAVGLVGDARQVLEALLPRVQSRCHETWLARFQACDVEEQQAVIDADIHPSTGPLRMAEVIHRLSHLTQGEALLVSDVGQHQMQAARYYRFVQPRSHITSGGLGTMGFGLPAAIGASIAQPHRPVVAVVGDGGMQMNLQELGVLMQEQIPVKLIILNNGHLGMVRQWQELFFDKRYSFVAMQSPDFPVVAQGYGIPASRVAERQHLDAALVECLAADGPYVLEVLVGQEDNVFPMIPAGAAVDEVRLS